MNFITAQIVLLALSYIAVLVLFVRTWSAKKRLNEQDEP